MMMMMSSLHGDSFNQPVQECPNQARQVGICRYGVAGAKRKHEEKTNQVVACMLKKVPTYGLALIL